MVPIAGPAAKPTQLRPDLVIQGLVWNITCKKQNQFSEALENLLLQGKWYPFNKEVSLQGLILFLFLFKTDGKVSLVLSL